VPFDTHLMIENPERFITEFAKAGSNVITVHPETTYHLHRLIYQIKDAGAKPGVALNPATPISAIEWLLGDLDRVLVMTVNPGFGGQAFITEMLQKIRVLSEMRTANGYRYEIGVDGGVNADTAPLVRRAGADVLIAGSAVFHHPEGVAAAVAELRQAAATAKQ
jgi:ribulose-phosphate 3-epimerase